METLGGGLEEFIEDESIQLVGEVSFGMPLDGEEEGIIACLVGFDDLVVGHGERGESIAELVDGLMMTTVDVDALCLNPLDQLGMTVEGHGVFGEAIVIAVIDVFIEIEVRQMLMDAAAVGDVDHLHAEAQGEDGLFNLTHLFVEHEFKALSAGMD